jgi:glutaredoxin 3
MAQVVIYTTGYCPYCVGAKALLRSKNVPFEEIDVSDDPERRAEMEQLSRRRTVPQIFIDGKPIGGYDDARLLDAKGELDRLLGCTESLEQRPVTLGK